MNKNFDFDQIGKREPYKTPDRFFEHLEEKIISETVAKPRRIQFPTRAFFAAAAAVAAIVAMALYFDSTLNNEAYTMDNVEQVFAQLSDADQDFLIDTYQEDIFIND